MIKIVVKVTVKPGKAEDFKNIAAELVAETRKEEGCISYQLFQDNQNPDLLFFIEEWTNGEALNAPVSYTHLDVYKRQVVYLAADESAYVTGSILSVDGGYTCI